MSVSTWIAVILAVLGVLHGPGTQAMIQKLANRKGKQ